jgi:hypothetical protein
LVGPTNCHLGVLSDRKSWKPQPPGALRAYLDMYRDTFIFHSKISIITQNFEVLLQNLPDETEDSYNCNMAATS